LQISEGSTQKRDTSLEINKPVYVTQNQAAKLNKPSLSLSKNSTAQLLHGWKILWKSSRILGAVVI
jgi:hypothetical protein